MLASVALGLAFTLSLPKLGETTQLGHSPGHIRLALTLVSAGSTGIARHPAVRPYLADGPKLGSESAREAVAADLRSRVLRRAPAWAKQGRLDLLLEGVMHFRNTDRKEFAEIVRLMQGVVKPVAEKYLPGQVTALPEKDPFAKTWDDRFLLKFDPVLLREKRQWDHDFVPWRFEDKLHAANEVRKSQAIVRANRLTVDWDASSNGFFLVRDVITTVPRPRWEQEWVCSFIVCGGDVSAADLGFNNILVADGDVKLSGKPLANRSSLVIATGEITTDLDLRPVDCCLIAGGRIKSYAASNTRTSVLYAGGVIDVIDGLGSKFGKHTPNFDFAKTGLKFFTLADVGLALEKFDGAVNVKAVEAKSPFRAAVQPGDQLLDVNNRKIDSVSEGKRALRAATVLEYAVLTVRRKDREHKVIVYLPDLTPVK